MWFDVDKAGLAKLLERKGKAFAVLELVQNALDTNAGNVEVELTPLPGVPVVHVRVVDDDPDGFKDLSHAFTLFAESAKKGDAEKRGRFNLGEKLVLALCDEAEICSTTGSIIFDKDGRRKTRRKVEVGSVFVGHMRMTRQEMEEALEATRSLLVPAGVNLVVNGELIKPRVPVAVFEASLPTEIADADGFMRRSIRKTQVRVYEPSNTEAGSLYEMGIPVMETGDRYHVDIQQKVPLNMDRDNVPPAYLRQLRAFVLNATFKMLPDTEVTQPWVRDATAHDDVDPAAVSNVMDKRFTSRAVRFDPSDIEANKLAAEAGFVVVHGGSLSHEEWENADIAGKLLPAGQVTPSHPLSSTPAIMVPADEITAGMRDVKDLAINLAFRVMNIHLDVVFINNPTVSAAATYGSRTLTFNVARLGRAWFSKHNLVEINALLIHEFAHEYAGDHKSDKYYDACCKLGAKFVQLCMQSPMFFQESMVST